MLPDNVLSEIFDGVMHWFGYPEQSRSFFIEQARNENCDADFNPLACTQHMPGSTVYNDHDVQAYKDSADGIQATVWTLDPNIYGGIDYFPAIRAALHDGKIRDEMRGDIAREMDAWGTRDFAIEIRNGWQMDSPTSEPTPAPTPEPAPLPEPNNGPVIDATIEARVTTLENGLAALNAAVLARFKFLADATATAANPEHIP